MATEKSVNIPARNFWLGWGFSLFIFNWNFPFSGYSLYFIFCLCSKQLLLLRDGQEECIHV